MKAYGGMEVQHYCFLSLVPDGVEFSVYCLGRSTSGQRVLDTIEGVSEQCWIFGKREEFLASGGFLAQDQPACRIGTMLTCWSFRI